MLGLRLFNQHHRVGDSQVTKKRRPAERAGGHGLRGDMERRICNLTGEDGVDSGAFYISQAIVDAFINKYRGVFPTAGQTMSLWLTSCCSRPPSEDADWQSVRLHHEP